LYQNPAYRWKKNNFPFKISDNQSYSTAKIQQHKSNQAKPIGNPTVYF
jgi:hypothetical protein